MICLSIFQGVSLGYIGVLVHDAMLSSTIIHLPGVNARDEPHPARVQHASSAVSAGARWRRSHLGRLLPQLREAEEDPDPGDQARGFVHTAGPSTWRGAMGVG